MNFEHKLEQIRQDAIEQADRHYLAQFKRSVTHKRPNLVPYTLVAIILSVVAVILTVGLLMNELTPDKVITQQVIEKQPIINYKQVTNNITNTIVPEGYGKCVKISHGNKYTLHCEKVIK